MKALIFTMSCGEGHNMLANSVAQAFNDKGVTTKIVQTFGYDDKRVQKENKKYLWACKRIPHLYDSVWNILRKKDFSNKKPPYYIKKCLNYFTQAIISYQPDIIVCTHYYASNVIAYMKKEGLIDNKITTSTVLFDFCLSPYWELSKNVDYIFTPSEENTAELIKKGYSLQQIKPFGLPVRAAFNNLLSQDEARMQLGIDDKFTVLIVSGGNGLGNTQKLVKNILKYNKNINIICINGHNTKTFEQLEKLKQTYNFTNLINVGFVKNMEVYMKACDLIVTRCGGCGISEVLNCEKPFIVREKLIINEKINKKQFIAKGCALGMKKITDAGRLVKYVSENPKVYALMQDNIKKFAKHNSAEKIVEFLMSKQ